MPGEETENQILERLLGAKRRLPAAPTSRGKIKWLDDIVACFEELGGRVSYPDLYAAVWKRRTQSGRTWPPSADAIIRREVENHSSDSQAFLGDEDIFFAPEGLGAGVWQLRRKKR